MNRLASVFAGLPTRKWEQSEFGREEIAHHRAVERSWTAMTRLIQAGGRFSLIFGYPLAVNATIRRKVGRSGRLKGAARHLVPIAGASIGLITVE